VDDSVSHICRMLVSDVDLYLDDLTLFLRYLDIFDTYLTYLLHI